MSPNATLASTTTFKKAGVRETAVLLALAWFVPFAVHLVPWSGARPLGVYLLPMFWTAFVAAYLYGGIVGLAVGLFAPAINLIVTGLPAGRTMAESSFELIVFALVTSWAVQRMPRLILIAPLGYIVARLAWVEWLALTDPTVQFIDIGTAMSAVGRSLTNGLAGLVVLATINIGLVWFYPKVPPPENGKSAPAE